MTRLSLAQLVMIGWCVHWVLLALSATDAVATQTDWALRFRTYVDYLGGTINDDDTWIGVAPNATDGYDSGIDVVRPPWPWPGAPGEYVLTAHYRPVWGKGLIEEDYRSPVPEGTSKVWGTHFADDLRIQLKTTQTGSGLYPCGWGVYEYPIASAVYLAWEFGTAAKAPPPDYEFTLRYTMGINAKPEGTSPAGVDVPWPDQEWNLKQCDHIVLPLWHIDYEPLDPSCHFQLLPDTARFKIIVTNPTEPAPSCAISFEPSSPTTDDVIVFDSGAADPYDTIISVAWEFGDGTAAEGDPALHQYAMPGVYQVTVTVCNAAGLCATCAEEVVIGKGANIPPMCEVTYTPASPLTDEEVTFDANAWDPNPWGEIVACAWDFGDGGAASGDPVTHAYSDAGTYTACVTVTDDQGGQTTCCAQVTVTAPCVCDVAIDRTHCKMPAAGQVGQCKTGQIGARNLSYTESCDVIMRVIDNAGVVVFESEPIAIGPGRRIRLRFEHCYTADEIGRNLWSWEVWPAECGERTPWDNAYLRKVNVQPGERSGGANWLSLWRLWRR